MNRRSFLATVGAAAATLPTVLTTELTGSIPSVPGNKRVKILDVGEPNPDHRIYPRSVIEHALEALKHKQLPVFEVTKKEDEDDTWTLTWVGYANDLAIEDNSLMCSVSALIDTDKYEFSTSGVPYFEGTDYSFTSVVCQQASVGYLLFDSGRRPISFGLSLDGFSPLNAGY